MLIRLALMASLALTASAASAGPQKASEIQISEAWSRPAAAGGNGAGFFTITNASQKSDTLVSVTSTAANKVEMHQTSMANGVMSMQQIQNGIPLPPGSSVTFAPGGKHLMVMGLKVALRSGSKLPLTFKLKSGQQLTLQAQVR